MTDPPLFGHPYAPNRRRFGPYGFAVPRGLRPPVSVENVATSVLDLDLPELNPFDRGSGAEPFAALTAVAEQHWAARSPIGIILLHHEDCTQVLRDPRFHQAARTLDALQGVTDERWLARRRTSILTAEGAEHTRLRKLVARAFTPRAADRFRPLMRRVVTELATPLVSRGGGDLVAEVTDPYPIPIICALLGAPTSDLALFSRWAEDILKIFSFNLREDLPVIMAAQDEMDAYVEDLIVTRRLHPGEDLLTDLIVAEEEGDRLSHAELGMMAQAILVAGTGTTRNQLAIGLWLLCAHPEQWEQLRRDPTLAPQAAEEILRHHGAVRGTLRQATIDVALHGVIIPAGTLVAPSLAAANRDTTVFDAPDTFDITRVHPKAQMTFGAGIHYCLGASLARAELAEALQVLSAMLDDLKLDGEVTWRPPLGIQGPRCLPVGCRGGAQP